MIFQRFSQRISLKYLREGISQTKITLKIASQVQNLTKSETSREPGTLANE